MPDFDFDNEDAKDLFGSFGELRAEAIRLGQSNLRKEEEDDSPTSDTEGLDLTDTDD